MAEDGASRDAREPHADGRPDRLPHLADGGQQARDRQADRRGSSSNLISDGAVALSGRAAARVSGVRAAARVHEHEPRAPSRLVSRPVRRPGRRRVRSGRTRRARFYEEYFAVADLPAEFYLETVRRVFQEYALARGAAQVARPEGQSARRSAARRSSPIEGERDDICSLGQTLAAHDLCAGLRPYMQDALHPGRCRPLRRLQRQALDREHLSGRAGVIRFAQ